MRKTKIVCTIGPASASTEMQIELIKAGMNVARMNFSHGSGDVYENRIKNLRNASARTGTPIALLADLQGPKIRVGEMEADKVYLARGSIVNVTSEPIVGNARRFTINYPYLLRDVGKGNTIFLDDGLLELKVIENKDDELVCSVEIGGELGPRKGVSLPGVKIDLPAVTDKDLEDIKFAVEAEIDYLAISFVRQASHVHEVREVLKQYNADIDLIAKIESQEALEHLDEIIAEADAIMVARGDLGVEIPAETVPIIQRDIIKKCNAAGKPVITATQMLESMKKSPRPTRAEVTDVAHAILDGTDAIMLSGETAVGEFPIEAVKVMNKTAIEIEKSLQITNVRSNIGDISVAEAISHATVQSANELNAAAIITSTQSGSTAKKVSRFRPKAMVLAATPSDKVMRKLCLVWGIKALLVPKTTDIDSMIDVSVEAGINSGIIREGDLIAITAGVKTDTPGSTNLLKIHIV
ncbi:MAG: pyruvate kinase [Firmicutes bacterium]|nr:pyruvate kinase [Bacillota bacterium]MDD4693469.1 pyruvate kinase [Bacillota bacterium]